MRKRKTGFKAKYLCKAKFKSQAPHNQAPHNLALQIRLRHAVWAFGKCSASVPKNGDRCTNPGELFNFELLRLNMPRKSHCGHHHFPRDIIPCAVQWRLRYSLPYQSRTMRDRMSGSACGVNRAWGFGFMRLSGMPHTKTRFAQLLRVTKERYDLKRGGQELCPH